MNASNFITTLESEAVARRRMTLWLGVIVLFVAAVMIVAPPFAQPQSYHDFADQRRLFGIPHFGDVLTNALFTAVGVWGLWVVRMRSERLRDMQIWPAPYFAFSIAMVLLGFGSAYYHWAPSNATLFWDRAAMSIAFMALLASMIAARIGTRVGKKVLWPLLIFGLGCVAYWPAFDDLRPYFLMQGLLAVLIAAMSWRLPSPRGLHGRHLHALAAFYIAAVVCEQFDTAIWEFLGHTFSGHNLKHIAAAAGSAAMIAYVKKITSAVPARRSQSGS